MECMNNKCQGVCNTEVIHNEDFKDSNGSHILTGSLLEPDN